MSLTNISPLSSGALLGLAAAIFWGGGDFAGGMGAKAAGTTRGTLRVMVLAHASSLAVLIALALLQGGPLPTSPALFWGLGAGVAAGFSVLAFYVALARGAMGASAAVSGLLAAAIPAVVGAVLEGSPGPVKLAGFLIAGVAIWIIAAEPSGASGAKTSSNTMLLAIVGGVGFGVYFVALRQANSLGVLQPLALARTGSLCVCLLLLRLLKPEPGETTGFRMNRGMVLGALGIVLLDTGGNLLFVASTRHGRLDVAAVLASLYPATTILLAAWHLHEKPTRRQAGGMLLALAAVVMITL